MRDRWVAVAIGCVGVVGYLIAGGGAPTVYDYYGRLAEAFVHGRYWLTEDPPWLNELLSCGDGRWCVAYPPLPAILAIPLIWAGTANAQGAVAQICGGASAGVLYAALRAYGAPRAIAITGAVLSAFGTTLLFSSADGRSWFAAHAVAMLFTSVAFLIAARGGPAWASARRSGSPRSRGCRSRPSSRRSHGSWLGAVGRRSVRRSRVSSSAGCRSSRSTSRTT